MCVKKASYYDGHGCTASFVEDLIVASKNLLTHLDELLKKFNLRNCDKSLEIFLGLNWSNVENKTKVFPGNNRIEEIEEKNQKWAKYQKSWLLNTMWCAKKRMLLKDW